MDKTDNILVKKTEHIMDNIVKQFVICTIQTNLNQSTLKKPLLAL
jgi:hypothetical protein